ncbi:DUF6261 family protein [Labilibaculum euxinus]|uniref:Uncharacterized protein n=1 Tax=Labilibaculum euxinus TaxID=2686357 RepID=A0A7M4D6Y4_9BACT|nr:DUF6261 family protein [Labilibaculum euxinus]MUP38413.1 hypothetical protein [Labilibaculum euxinus]MVB07618.1 hypothetical protein [Labilibaculum euxinus]
MNQQLLAHAKAIEVGMIAIAIVDFWKMKKPKINDRLQLNLEELTIQSKILQDSFGTVRNGAYTLEMKKQNSQIASLFVGLKYMIKAYLHHPDKEIVNSAGRVWGQLAVIGVDTHKKNLEKKISGLQILTERLLSGKLKADADKLKGTEKYLTVLHLSLDQLKVLYRLTNTEQVKRKQRVQTTAQAHKVHRILNDDIFPFLFTFRQVDPDRYDSFARFVEFELKNTNAVIRARRTRWANKKKEDERI